jgi:hypothetical protein
LVPPSYYELRLKGQPARIYRTIAETAWAFVELAPKGATLAVVTGQRRRGLSDRELMDLLAQVRTRRGLFGGRSQR